MKRSTVIITGLSGMIVILYFVATKTLKKDEFIPILPAPAGERTYTVSLQHSLTKRAPDGTLKKISESSLRGIFEERWSKAQDDTIRASFLFAPEQMVAYGKNRQDLAVFQKPVSVSMKNDGSLIEITYPSELPPGSRTLLANLVFLRNFTRGETERWHGEEFDETGPITVRYSLDENSVVRNMGDSNAREGYQTSKIVYHLTAEKQVQSIDVDLTYVKIIGESKLVSSSHGSFNLVPGSAPRLAAAKKLPAGGYQSMAWRLNVARPVITDNPSMPRIDIHKAWNTLEEVLTRGDQKEKTSFYMALSRYFAAHAEDFEETKDYLLAIDPSSSEYRDKVALIVGALDQLVSPKAEELLIALIQAASLSLRDDIVFQSTMSLGRHLAPSSKSIDVLWQTYNNEALAEESRHAALMALGSVAAHLSEGGAQKVRRLLTPLVESSDTTHVIVGLAAMANHGDSTYFKAISENARNHPEMTVRLEAVRALARVRSAAAAELLQDKALSDTAGAVRLMAAKSLARQVPGKRELKAALDLYQTTGELAVKETALEAISLLSKDGTADGHATLEAIYQKETSPDLKALAATYLRQRTD